MVLSPLSRAPSCRAPRQRLRLHTAHLHRCGMSLRPSGEGPAGPPAKQRWQWRRRRRTAMAAAWALAVSCAALLAPGAGGAPLAFQHHEPQQSVPLIADNDPAATAAAAVGHGRRALAAPHVAAGGAPVRAVPHGAPPPHYTIEKHHDVPCPPSSPYNSTTARSKRPPRPTGARPLPPSVKVPPPARTPPGAKHPPLPAPRPAPARGHAMLPTPSQYPAQHPRPPLTAAHAPPAPLTRARRPPAPAYPNVPLPYPPHASPQHPHLPTYPLVPPCPPHPPYPPPHPTQPPAYPPYPGSPPAYPSYPAHVSYPSHPPAYPPAYPPPHLDSPPYPPAPPAPPPDPPQPPAPPQPPPSIPPLPPISGPCGASAWACSTEATDATRTFGAFPAGRYHEKEAGGGRSWLHSPYAFKWASSEAVERARVPLGEAAPANLLCLWVLDRPGGAPDPNTTCSQGLSNYLYKVGITTQPDLVVDKFESCVKRTFKLLPDGRLLRGTVTWVNTRVSKSPFFTEVHVHNFGDGPIQVGDRVCLDVDPTCDTPALLCGPKCGVAVWSGPGGDLIHQCAPRTGLPWT